MGKLAHGIAVVVGFILYMATKNILIAAVIAVVLEGIVLALMDALPQLKSNKEQFAAWQAGTAEAPPLRKLWWRIALIVVFVILIASGYILAPEAPSNSDVPQGSSGTLFLTLVLCIPIVLSALSLRKAQKWNETIRQAQSSGHKEQTQESIKQ